MYENDIFTRMRVSNKQLGTNISIVRKLNNIDVATMADMLNIHTSKYLMYEKGDIEIPKYILNRFCEELKCSQDLITTYVLDNILDSPFVTVFKCISERSDILDLVYRIRKLSHNDIEELNRAINVMFSA